MTETSYAPATPRTAAVNELSGTGGRWALAVLFAIYLMLLVWLVLWKFHVPFVGRDDMREIKLIPFVGGGGFGASAPWEVFANIIIFLPFGIYLAALVPTWRWRAVAVMAGASLGLEVAEYVLAVGSSDVTDVIVNTSGGLIGLGVLALVRRKLRSRTGVVMAWIMALATVVVFIAATALIASFPRLGPPDDVDMRVSCPCP
ncbi:MAG TPA: VanZ family protein [Pseudolysinimonas sp.]|nr:VanZ family protein [Pseudolysinimonas sp.]